MAHIKQVNLDSGSYLIEPTLYATATVSSDGKTYTASFNTNFELVNGVCVQIKCPNKTNTAPTTFNTKNIYYNGEAIASNTLKANHTYALVYDGTQWQLVGDIDTNTTYTNGTGLNLNNGEFSVKYGNEAGTAVQGNDSRLSDARTPTSHSHGNITNDGEIGSTADLAVYTTTGGKLTAGTLETSAPTASGTALSFITSVSQDSKGKIAANKATVATFVKSGSNASAGLVPKPSTTEGTTKFLREDATWQTAVTSITIKTSAPLTGGSNTATTTTGTYTIGFNNQDANTIFAGPSSGNAAVPTFRALVAADIPNLSWNKITSDKPTTLGGYGITDAKIASDVITLGSNTITPVTSVNGHTGSSVSVTAGDLGLSSALRFIGKTTSDMSESFTGVPAGISSYTSPIVGDVVLDKNSDAEYVCIAKTTSNNTTTYTWELLGRSGSWSLSDHEHGDITNGGLLGAASVAVVTDGSKKITTADLTVNDTDASTSATTTFVQAVTQSGQGKITVTKAALDTSGNWDGLAAKATADASGNTITTYYCTLSTAQTLSGAKTFSAALVAQNNVTVGTTTAGSFGIAETDGAGRGISLYGGPKAAGSLEYGIMFAKTATFGKCGSVTSDWATYFTMNRSDTRGWIFKSNGGAANGNNNVVSIAGNGNIYTAGTLKVNDTTASTGTTVGAIITAGGIGTGAASYLTGSVHIVGTAANDALIVRGISGSWSDGNRDTTATNQELYLNYNGGKVQIGFEETTAISTNMLKIAYNSDSSSTSTGALVVDGGVGIAKTLYVGTGIYTANNGSTSTGIATEAALKIREYNYSGSASDSDTWGQAPRLAWIWNGRKSAQIGLASNGQLYEAPNSGTTYYKIVYETGTWGINISKNAASATALKNSGRLTDANITRTTDGGVRFFLATSSMTNNKPSSDGHILHFHWDDNTSNAWDSQLFIPDGHTGKMQWRGHANATTWGTGWHTILDDQNTAAGTDNTSTLTWNTTYIIAKINDTDIKFTTMVKPTYAFTDLTSHPTTLSGYGITDAAASDHTHGNITNGGCVTTAITLAKDDYIIVGDNSASGKIGKGPVFVAAISSQTTSTRFLREDGSWAAPSYIANIAYGNINTSGQIGQTSNWALASGDGLVVFDSSNSNKLERTGITFDASTESKVLSKKGTWVDMYTHPTGSGNNHIPSGGSTGQFLKYSSSGVATWSALPTASTSAAGIIQIGTESTDAMAGNTNVKIVQQTGITTSNDYPILFKNGANTTDEAAGINYSNNINEDVTKTLPITINPSTGTLNVPQIKISIKSDSYGLFPHTNNYNQIGSTNLYWYRAYITNYYGTTSNITNWVSGKNIGTPCTKSAASILGSVNFYNTCVANGTQTKTLLTANSATNSDITLTFPTRTGLLALTTDEEIIIGTQTGKTGDWTGTSSNITALYDGLTIKYYLNRDPNSNASLNLTLADGTTTGAIPCYYNSGRLTTHYAVGSVITLTYFSAGSITVNGTATTDNRWIADANYDSGNTNTATRQKVRTTDANYSLLFADPVVGTADNNTAYYTYRNDSIYVNPSTGNVYATAFNGSGASLTSLNASNLSSGTIGNARLPARLQEYHTTATNNTTASGWYYGNSDSPFTKYHTGNTDFMVWTHGYDTNWASEIGTDFRSNRLAVRNKNNGTWNSWRELAGNDDIVNEFSWTSDVNYDSVTNTFTNTRASNSWASQVYSKHGFSDGCYVSWKTVDATHHMMIGLNSDPTTNANWTGLDYAWYMYNNGAMDIRESNSTKTPLTGHTTYAAGDDFRIEYNNGQIRYYHNGVCCRTVERAISGQLYLDSSLYNGGTITDLRFGPITNIGTISIAHGGTGATSAADARTNLGLGSIATYGAATAGTKDTWGLVPVIGASDGVMEVGKYIDFHTTDGNTKDYDVRITAATTGLTISGTTSGTFSGSLTGNADTATTATNLSAAPTITQTGTATVNLAANTTYTLTVGGKSVIFKTPSNANTDTLVNYTLGATTKAYLMASQNAPTSTTTARAAHGDTLVYLTATSGQLSAKSYSINDGAATPAEKVHLEWNATDQSLDFVFA